MRHPHYTMDKWMIMTSVWDISKSVFEQRKETSFVDSPSTRSNRGRSIEGTDMIYRDSQRNSAPPVASYHYSFQQSQMATLKIKGWVEEQSQNQLILSQNKKAC